MLETKQTNQLVKVSDKDLQEAAFESIDAFLDVFIQAYKDKLGEDVNAQNMHLLNGWQHAVLSYGIFREEVLEGGFIQLIQNGYGPYIFDNPFAKAMRLIGVKSFSKLIYAAKEIYDKHRSDLERERTEEEFMAMYEQYEIFDALEEQFMEMEEEITETIAHYVDGNMAQFALIEKK